LLSFFVRATHFCQNRGFSSAPFPQLYDGWGDCVFLPTQRLEPWRLEAQSDEEQNAACDVVNYPSESFGCDCDTLCLCRLPIAATVVCAALDCEDAEEAEDEPPAKATAAPLRVTDVAARTFMPFKNEPKVETKTVAKKTTAAKALAPVNEKKGEAAAAAKSKKAKKREKKEKKARLVESGKESLYSRAICNR
jgi:hypothetical protein